MIDLADRTMVLERVINAPVALVWGAWMNPETLPQWWGPEGYTCRTKRINLGAGGEWVFDMIGPDGTVYASDPAGRAIHRVTPDGVVSTLVAGQGLRYHPVDALQDRL